MRRFSMDAARRNLTDIVNAAHYKGERIAIGRRNKDLAVVVSLEDAALLERLEDQADLRAIRRALKEPGPNISLAEVKRRIQAKKAGK